MRTILPFLVGFVATIAGLGAARLRDLAMPPVVPVRRGLNIAVWLGVVATGSLLLGIGWWASGIRIAEADPAMLSSVAYVGASVELFLGGVLATRVIRGPISAGARERRPPR